MSTLVEWLRTAAKARSDIDAYLHGEAADEIERLRAATVRLTEEINELRQDRERLRTALVEIGHVLSADPLEGRDAHAEILAIIGEALSGCHAQSQNG